MIKTGWNFIPPVALVAAKALTYMASVEGLTTCGSTASVVGCSLSYMEQVFAELRRAGLVNAQRGPGGGYSLARKPDSILIADVVKAFVEEEQSLPAGLDAIRERLKEVLSTTNLKQVMEAAS